MLDTLGQPLRCHGGGQAGPLDQLLLPAPGQGHGLPDAQAQGLAHGRGHGVTHLRHGSAPQQYHLRYLNNQDFFGKNSRAKILKGFD